MAKGTIRFLGFGLALALFASRGAAQLPNIPLGSLNIEVQDIATGLNAPLEMAYPNDGSNRLFIVEQGGRVKVYKPGTGVLPALFLDATSGIATGSETGMLGLAFHPGFSDSASPGFRKLYTYRSRPAAGTPDFPVPGGAAADHHDVIEEWQVSSTNPDVVDTTIPPREILRGGHPQGNHNGGEISFRPSDGYLYIGFGDGGNGNDVGPGHTANVGNGQDKTNVLGDILRIDPLDPTATAGSTDPVSANGKYRIPASNPFIGAILGADEIFAWGFRNPYRFSFDVPNDRLVVGDVGQSHIEEVDIVDISKNYGWNKKEGSFLFNSADASVSPDPSPDPNLINPVAQYDHDDGISVIGGFVYHGTAMPALAGKYIFGDLLKPGTSTGRLFYADLSTGQIQEFRLGLPPRALGAPIHGWGEDSSGELYVITDAGGTTGGRVRKLVPIAPSIALANLSTRGNIGTGQNVLIGGFIITGSAPKKVLLRAIGPSLTVNGQPLPGRLADPFLELHASDGSLITSNDDWQSAPNAQEVTDSGAAPTDPKESAIMTSPLQPGAYTAIMSGVGGGTGIGLVEIYDAGTNVSANLTNISTRGNVGTANNVMIGGFIIAQPTPRNVLIRALGPSLSGSGVTSPLQDPTLELRDKDGALIASNDNWKTTQQAQIQATGLAPTMDAESAIVASGLVPNGYTAVVAGAGGTTGIALVEIYWLP